MLARYVMSVCIAGLLALLSVSPTAQRFEDKTGLGLLYMLRGSVEAPPGALVIALDSQSVAWLNRNVRDLAAGDLRGCLTPHAVEILERTRNINAVPRAVHSCLLQTLAPLQPSVVVFDINFNSDGPDDQAFAAAIQQHGNVVLLERVITDGLIRSLAPAPPLSDAAGALAMFKSDGSNSEVATSYPTRLALLPDKEAMPLAALRLQGGPAPDRAMPPLQMVWFYGPPQSIPTVSIRTALSDASALPADLSETVVFIGASDPATPQSADHFLMPSFFGSEQKIGGVEIAATAYLNLLQGALPRRLAAIETLVVVFFVSLAILVAGLSFAGRKAVFAVVIVAAVYLGISALLFTAATLSLPVAMPLLISAPMAIFLATILQYRVAQEFVRRLAPRRLADELLSLSSAQRSSPRKEEATVMFIDLEGSTYLGTRLPPDLYHDMVGAYYEIAGAEIEARGGSIVEFKGDGVLAIFGRAELGPRHAAAAVEAATNISARIDGLDSHPDATGTNRLKLRFGINSGNDLTLGAVGTDTRFNFNAVGDTVNTAARLEQLGKRYHEEKTDVILLSGETFDASGLTDADAIWTDAVQLSGRTEQTDIYRILPRRLKTVE